jgi:hypothetical protein
MITSELQYANICTCPEFKRTLTLLGQRGGGQQEGLGRFPKGRSLRDEQTH